MCDIEKISTVGCQDHKESVWPRISEKTFNNKMKFEFVYEGCIKIKTSEKSEKAILLSEQH